MSSVNRGESSGYLYLPLPIPLYARRESKQPSKAGVVFSKDLPHIGLSHPPHERVETSSLSTSTSKHTMTDAIPAVACILEHLEPHSLTVVQVHWWRWLAERFPPVLTSLGAWGNAGVLGRWLRCGGAARAHLAHLAVNDAFPTRLIVSSSAVQFMYGV
jgi:hypothetical protein